MGDKKTQKSTENWGLFSI